VLEKVSEAKPLQVKHSGCLSGVEHIDDVQSEVSLEPLHVLISTVQHLRDTGVVENVAQGVAEILSQRNRINNEVFLAA
jgi:hypothetical protein